jgi:hypothetical protein
MAMAFSDGISRNGTFNGISPSTHRMHSAQLHVAIRRVLLKLGADLLHLALHPARPVQPLAAHPPRLQLVHAALQNGWHLPLLRFQVPPQRHTEYGRPARVLSHPLVQQ